MELVTILFKGEGVTYQNYDPLDDRLILSNLINSQFGAPEDSIESIFYDQNGSILDIVYDNKQYHPEKGYINSENGLFSSVSLDPKKDAYDRGYNRGSVTVQYNFFKNLFNSSYERQYWIKDISNSGTEIRLSSQGISDTEIIDGFTRYQEYVSSKNYYTDFYLNFGLNRQIIAINVAYETTDEGSFLLIKLYEPLPPDFGIKSTLWIVEKLSESVSYEINTSVETEVVVSTNSLRGPNFDIDVKEKVTQTTPYYSYNDLFSSELSSSIQQLASYYDDKAININVDYSNFSNFIHFSSATERIENFKYKLELIESYEAEIASYDQLTYLGNTSVLSISQSISLNKNKINNIINKFDPYEYYLYFDSGAFSWPKTNSEKPYLLYSTTSSQAISWLGSEATFPNGDSAVSILYSASLYDTTNKDVLTATIPQYLLEDDNNAPFIAFLNMISQHFDNVWLYYKDVSSRYDNTNNPNTGISIDLVADALKSLGINLYTNTNLSDNLYYSLFGMNPDGSLLPPTGSEIIYNYITSSIDTLPAKDIQKEIYKRIYHNVPYILKTKGTQRSIKALISCFGIPENILEVSEFGGYQRYQQSGTSEIYNDKISIIYDNQYLSSSLLNPHITVQKYDTDYRLNTLDIEVGFSPSNKINDEISQQLGFIDIDDYIGDPRDAYLKNYPKLERLKNDYFKDYTYPHSVWEYIRLVKYYNNAVFKIVKDFVPARSNASSGIIVKSHVLERNKYARNEPSASLQEVSKEIKMVSISAGPANTFSGSAAWSGKIMTPKGRIRYRSSDQVQKYTGEFSGSVIKAYDGDFNQLELSDNYSGSSPIYVNLGALYHNVQDSVRSIKFLDLDYSKDQIVPVNYNVITASISASLSFSNDRPYSNKNYPYARIQDTNYTSRAFTEPRYYGSKTISSKYTDFTPGDSSYGNTAAIDKIKSAFAYLVDIYSSSIFFPNRANGQIKYLIDGNQNVLDLTKANSNIFEIQNIFKSGETVDIALFKYDEKNPYSQQLANNPTLQIYEGGYRYLPIMHNVSGSLPYSTFLLSDPIGIFVSGSQTAFSPTDPQWNVTNYSIFSYGEISSYYNEIESYTVARLAITASYNLDTTYPGTISASLNVTIPRTDGQPYETFNIVFTPQGSYLASTILEYVYYGPQNAPNPLLPESLQFNTVTTFPPGTETSGIYTAYYIPSVTSSQNVLFYMTSSNEIVVKLSDFYGTQDLYNRFRPVFDSTIDPNFLGSGLEQCVSEFKISKGDRIAFYNSQSLGWDEKFEFVIDDVRFTGSANTTGSRLLIQLDRTPPLNLFTQASASQVESATFANYYSNRFVVYRHIPDETNVILRYNPKDSTIVEEGMLYPQYLSNSVKRNSGNIIKSLLAQNLIVSDRSQNLTST